jgi:DNA-binding response OmpR family regulator
MATILVIDDDPLIRELCQEILARGGHHVVLAESGARGLGCADSLTELVVVDLLTPDMNGYQFLKQFRAIDGHGTTPVIATSGLATGQWALRTGADRFLPKPFRSDELLALVNELLRRGGTAA